MWLEEKISPIRKPVKKPPVETSKGRGGTGKGKGKRKREQSEIIEAEANLTRRAIAPVEFELPGEEAAELMLVLQLTSEELTQMV